MLGRVCALAVPPRTAKHTTSSDGWRHTLQTSLFQTPQDDIHSSSDGACKPILRATRSYSPSQTKQHASKHKRPCPFVQEVEWVRH